MNIKMMGIDHEKASLQQREIFAFTASQAEAAMKCAVTEFEIQGAVIISTCNRTELWISENRSNTNNIETLFYHLKGIPEEGQRGYSELFVIREGKEAFLHLFQTTCGLKSQVFGEDQILSQVKKSIEAAREAESSDAVLEKLFQMAVTSAKRIKTAVKITGADVSIATRTIKLLEEQQALSEANCMVIGNGEMGRLVAQELVKKSRSCCMTLRSYKYTDCLIPQGCNTSLYEERYEKLKEMDIVISATASPHFTIKMEELRKLNLHKSKPLILVDLAVPRDIEPDIASLENIRLYDMDSMGMNREDASKENIALAEEIIKEYLEEFAKFYHTKEFLPAIKNISRTTTERISSKMKKELDELELDEKDKRFLKMKLMQISERAVSGLLFNVKDSIGVEHWQTCFSNLEKIVR